MQNEVRSILIIFFVLSGLILWTHHDLKRFKYGDKPKGLVLFAILFVEAILNITIPVMGEKQGRAMAAYIGSVFLYLLFSNWSGLFGLDVPTSNFSVTLALAFVTWILIQVTKIRNVGVKGYMADFLSPFAFFLIPNIFGTIAPLISLSLRLFGNVLSGSVIMTLLYNFTQAISSKVPIVGQFNFFGAFVAPWIHMYFDLFSGFLQAFLFISLTTIFIGIEMKEEI